MLAALETVAAIVSKPSNPIMANVLIEATKDRVSLTTFNGDIGVTVEIDAAIEAQSAFTFPANFFVDVLKTLPDMPLLFDLDGSTLNIEFLGGSASISGIDAEHFPQLPTVEATGNTFEAAALIEAIRTAKVSVSEDKTKQVLCGVHFTTSDKGEIEVAATNGYHLSVVESTIDAPDDWQPVTVPTKSLDLLAKLTGDNIKIATDGKVIVFERDNGRVISRVLEGQYPHYRQLMPVQFDREIHCDAKELRKMIGYVAPYAAQNSNIVHVTNNDDSLRIWVKETENGAADLTFDDVTIKGGAMLWACDLRYINAGLSSFGGDIVIHQNTPTSAMVIKQKDDDRHVLLMMPIQIRDV